MATPFDPREFLAGATHVAAAVLADADGIRTALRDAARAACATAGLPTNIPAERLDQIAALGVAVAVGPLPEGPR